MSEFLRDTRLLARSFKKLLVALKPPSDPLIVCEITGAWVFSLLIDLFPEYTQHIYVSDSMYRLTTIGEIRRFVKWSRVDKYPWIADWHDCDDHAEGLAGDFANAPPVWSSLPTGSIWAIMGIGHHAFFIAIACESLEDPTPRPYYFEPQDDGEYAPEMVEDMVLTQLRV